MRTKVKLKSGISLIVLVITIIVMIILAAAIILSLSNSGIISKANKAKTDSDTANLKEYVNTLRAEWELMTKDERTNDGSSTFEDYANKKLEKKGYNKVAVGTDGEVYTNLAEAAKSAIRAGIKVGDTVTGYTLTKKTYTTDGSEQSSDGKSSNRTQTLETDTTVTWKYIGIGDDGSIEIAADLANKPVYELERKYRMNLENKGGALKGTVMLDNACEALYTTDKGTAKSMNIDHVIRILGYTGPKGSYDSVSGERAYTAMPLTIEEIVSSKGEPKLTTTQTPDGKEGWDNIKTYKSDYYSIDKINNVKEMKNVENIELVYPTNDNMCYWLASSCVRAFFDSGNADFYMRNVYGQSQVGATRVINAPCNFALRPVVSLNSNVTLTKNADGAWEIN